MRPRIQIKIYDNTGRRIFERQLSTDEIVNGGALHLVGRAVVDAAETMGARVDPDRDFGVFFD